jgi:hypothetical protein
MTDKPIGDDIRHDDLEYNPQLEPTKSLAWLNLLKESEDAFEKWNDHCDRIDKQYANLERLAQMGRDKEFQMFWANMEVIKPAIYAQAPIPVVVPKFKDRRPVVQQASEVLERCATVSFDLAYINEVMVQVRDDLALINRGVVWCRYESGKDTKSYYASERVCYDVKQRRDFLHSISRSWPEVTWVAAASYLTRAEARERFYQYSGDAYQTAEYKVDRDAKEVGGADNRERAKFWEIWDRPSRRVVWVSEGCEDILDEDDPHLDLQGFFPCPKPAYGSCQRGSLIPVPDVMQYKDQLEEINKLTGKIHALSDVLEAKGFYPSGDAEKTEAVEAAIKMKTPGRVLVPIANWATFGGTKEIIVWLPIDMIAEVIKTCMDLRTQVINDIYQIVGLSDIMRGSTDPRETYGAQSLKSSYGSSRVRDKQNELARIARDLVCITGDIICEKFKDTTIVEMSQTQLPTKQMQQRAVALIQQQIAQQTQALQQARNTPQAQQLAKSNPDQANQMLAQAQQQIQSGQDTITKIGQRPNIDQVLTFLHDYRLRSFVLDIETDSTIIVDEQAEKASRAEFMGMLAQLIPQLTQMLTAIPSTGDFCGQVLKFACAPYRAGRSLDGAIDDLIQMMAAKADEPRGDDPTTATNKTAIQIEQMKQQRQAEKDRADTSLKQQELQMRDNWEKLKLANSQRLEGMKLQGKQGDNAAKAFQADQQAAHEHENHQADMMERVADFHINQQEAGMRQQESAARQSDMAARQRERMAAQQFRQTQAAQRTAPPGII